MSCAGRCGGARKIYFINYIKSVLIVMDSVLTLDANWRMLFLGL